MSGNPAYFKTEEEQFFPLTELNDDQRIHNGGGIRILEASSFGLFALTYSGELFVYVKDGQSKGFSLKINHNISSPILDISCGNSGIGTEKIGNHCALDNSGRVYHFIFPISQFSRKFSLKEMEYSTNFEKVNIGEKAIQISACYEHCMAVGESGSLYIWGRNGYSQNGLKSTTPISHFSPLKFEELKDCCLPITKPLRKWSPGNHYLFTHIYNCKKALDKKLIKILLALRTVFPSPSLQTSVLMRLDVAHQFIHQN